MTPPQVHDLIRIDAGIAAHWDAPAWVAAALEHAPWVVVRRACAAEGIPIGVRGARRAQRFAARIEPGDVRKRIVPGDLVARSGADAGRLAHAARAVDAAARSLRIRWGPAGAYGFELASGTCATHGASDLDIVIDGDSPRAALAEFAARCAQIERTTHVRIDAEVLFESAGIALRELVSGAPAVLAKTPAGPLLVASPA